MQTNQAKRSRLRRRIAIGVTGVLAAAVGWRRDSPHPPPLVPQAHHAVDDRETAALFSPARDQPGSEHAPFVVEAMSAETGDEIGRRLRRWAARDAESALASALRFSDAQQRAEALTAVCFGVAETDPAQAVQLAVLFALDEHPGDVVENLVQQWAARDLAAALQWTARRTAGEPRDRCLARIVFVCAASAPQEAARLVVERMSPGLIQEEAAIAVLHRWAQQELPAAAAWVAQFPHGPLRDRAIDELAGIMSERG